MRLGDIVTIKKGKKPAFIVEDSRPTFKRLIQIDDLRPNAIPKYCPSSSDEVDATPNDIIIAWDGANAGTTNFGLSGVIGSTLAILRPNNKLVFTPYLGHYIIANNLFLRERCKGATVPHIDGGVLESLDISLPSILDQKRIADILDKADALRSKRRAALARLDRLSQSIFLEMFGDPTTNPRGWTISTVNNITEIVTDGEHLTPKRTTEGIKLLSARNIRDGYIDFLNVDHISSAEYTRIKRRCNPMMGDILISCSGTIGRVASVETNESFSLVRSAALVRVNSSIVNYKFLENYLRTPSVKARMLRRANASSQANLFQGQIRELEVYVPPLDLQKNFALRSAAVQRLKASLEVSLAKLEELFTSLQYRAFRGEL